jgi:PAS domain S-box-containing protein
MQNTLTKYRRIEQALGYLSLIADMAVEKTNEGVLIADLNGNVLFLNEAWCGMHGYKSQDELVGKHLSLFYTKEQMKKHVIPLFEKTKQYGQAEDTVEHIKNDRTVFAAQTKVLSVGNLTGNATGFIIFSANTCKSPNLKDATVKNLKQLRRLSGRIAQLRKLFSECHEIGECLAEQTNELQANNEMLLKQISKSGRSAPIPKRYSGRNLPWKTQVTITNELQEDTNPEQRQRKEAPAKNPEPAVKSERSNKPLNTKELRKVAELARRLSKFSKQNIRTGHKDAAVEL